MTLLAAVWTMAAWLGSQLGHRNLALVWPPTGIGLAALVLFGYRLWPGIALGAFGAFAAAGAPPAVAVGVTVGSVLEAVSGTYLLDRLVGFRSSLRRVRDVLGFVLVAALLSTPLGASIGALSLHLAGQAPLASAVWLEWWLCDALGALLVAPPLLTWSARPRIPKQARRIGEAGALLGAVASVGGLVFGRRVGTATGLLALVCLTLPLLTWCAMRFGPEEAASVSLVASAIAVLGTAQGHGPFALAPTEKRLLLLGSYMAVLAMAGLVLTAVAHEWRPRDLAGR